MNALLGQQTNWVMKEVGGVVRYSEDLENNQTYDAVTAHELVIDTDTEMPGSTAQSDRNIHTDDYVNDHHPLDTSAQLNLDSDMEMHDAVLQAHRNTHSGACIICYA